MSEGKNKVQVFEPHKSKLPPLKPYLRDFWRRREFATELSKFSDKAEYLESRLGNVWLVLNPLFLAIIYFLLVTIIRGGRGGLGGFTTLCHILIGLFTFYFAQNCITFGAQSITSGGKLILNQAFPRSLLPLSSAMSAFRQFWPTIPVYISIVVIGKLIINDTTIPGLTWNYLLVPFLFIILAITSFGLALLFATLNVYFRDTTKLLSYIMRIWLYASPVLWQPDMLSGWYRVILYINPLGPILSANSSIWIDGATPTLSQIIGCLVWAFITFIFGGYFFISRERDFAVRI
uniref:ABC transporter permease n=1 Tax=Candidatus Nanopelagicus sp. TaxID=2518620 RepID=UPI0040498CC3